MCASDDSFQNGRDSRGHAIGVMHDYLDHKVHLSDLGTPTLSLLPRSMDLIPLNTPSTLHCALDTKALRPQASREHKDKVKIRFHGVCARNTRS